MAAHKILVTGSAGFIGSSVVRRLLELGCEVVGVDNINDYYAVSLKYARLAECGIEQQHIRDGVALVSQKYPNYRFIKLDIKDSAAVDQCFASYGFTVVCNLAAQAGVRYSLKDPHSYIASNIVGFLNILEACRHNQVKHLVYASSSSVYGNNEKQPFATADNVDHPLSLYAATKKSNELMAHSYTHLFGLATTGLRFFTVYGPWGRPDMAPMLFAAAICAGQAIEVFNNGELERDFTYIDDIVDGVISVLLDSPAAKLYRLYNIGNNQPVKLMDFIATMEQALQRRAIHHFLPMQPGDVYRTAADITPLARDYGYSPRVGIAEGMGNFITWFKHFYNK